MKESKKISRPVIFMIDNFGLSHYTSYLARGVSNYQRVILYGLSKDDFLATGESYGKKIEFHSLDSMLPKGNSIPVIIIKSLFLFFTLLIGLIDRNYDIVHVQGHLPTFFLLIPLIKLKRKKIVWTVHDVELLPSSAGLRGKLDVLYTKLISQPWILGKYSNVIIVHALSLKQKLTLKKIDAKKIHVVPHLDYNYLLQYSFEKQNDPINDSKSSTDPKPLPKEYALFFGNILPWKGLGTLMEATKIILDRNGKKFPLVIAGTPYSGYQSYYHDLLKDIHEQVHVINKYIQSCEIPKIIKNSAFLILPYTDEFQNSVSGVIPLAYTFSKPVIVSNLGSLTEYVEDGKTGFIIEAGNSEQLAIRIMELSTNRDLCVTMGQNANEKLSKEMSLEICSEMINMIYENIYENINNFQNEANE